MQDTIIKGTGNSRTIKTVPNALTLYPDWPTALQAMINGTFPIDIGPLSASGVNTMGTALNKANLLSDETAGIFGFGADATVDDVLKKVVAVETGSYISATERDGTIIASGPILMAVIYVNRYLSDLEKVFVETLSYGAFYVTNPNTVSYTSSSVKGNQCSARNGYANQKVDYVLFIGKAQ